MKMCGHLGGKAHNIEDHCQNCSYNTCKHVSVCVVTNSGLTQLDTMRKSTFFSMAA